ncbi:helix-turn-helix domain-containing protein, partial [Bacillus toyonensis]
MLISRQKQLVQILVQDQHWHTLSELAFQLGYVPKTIRRDIAYLKEYLPTNWHIESVKGKGIRLVKPIEEGIDELESLFERHDMTFQILDLIFHQSVSTIKDLANRLYVQPSSLYNYLEKVRLYLAHFDVKLAKHPLRIQGTESHIIFLFSELYVKTYQANIWPFSALSQKEILHYIKQIENKLQITLYPIDRRKISYFLAVLLHRKKKKYTVFVHHTHAVVLKETEFYQLIASISSTLCGIELQTVDKLFITIVVNCSKYVHNDIEKNRQDMLQTFQAGQLAAYQHTNIFISMLENACHISLLQDKEFVFQMVQHLKRTIYKYSLIPNIEPPLESKMSIIKQTYDSTFQQVKQVYWEWIQKYNIAPFVWEEDVGIVTLQIEAVKLLSQSPAKTALLYTEDDFIWNRYIQGVLYHAFGTNLQVKSIPTLSIEMVEFTQ